MGGQGARRPARSGERRSTGSPWRRGGPGRGGTASLRRMSSHAPAERHQPRRARPTAHVLVLSQGPWWRPAAGAGVAARRVGVVPHAHPEDRFEPRAGPVDPAEVERARDAAQLGGFLAADRADRLLDERGGCATSKGARSTGPSRSGRSRFAMYLALLDRVTVGRQMSGR